MAAQDYYASFAPRQQRTSFSQYQQHSSTPTFAEAQTPYNQQLVLTHDHQPSPQPQQPYSLSPHQHYSSSPQQQYFPSPQLRPQSQSSYLPNPPYPVESRPNEAQYPSASQSRFPPPPISASNNSLMPPMRPVRSRSEPSAREQYHGRDDERHHRRRSHARSRSRRRSSYRDEDSDSSVSSRDYSRDRSRGHSRRQSRADSHDKARRNRDTFFGAGGGAIIGDAIFPGAGTLGGLLLGGLGGNHYARRRSRSELPPAEHEKYRDGITVNSGWLRR